MKTKLPLHCPGCDSTLKVSELFCKKCNTKVCGTFDIPVLARLDEKDQIFILDFIKASGSLKDMAKTMGLSYPTVRNRLDDLIARIQEMEKPISD